MPISIVIPAHNESSVIQRCLGAIFSSTSADNVSVVVVCNGCDDDTAGRARATGSSNVVEVLETEMASKSHALNLGDAAAAGFPRIYVDADVVLGPQAIKQMTMVLQQPGVLATAPRMRIDCSDRSWLVRSYYAVWQKLPYCRSGMIGSGVYALSEEGRRRFGKFPDVIADDAFVRLHFAPHERRIADGCTFTVTPPTTLGDIINIKTRSHFGNKELQMKFPALWHNEEVRSAGPIVQLLLNPLWWPALIIYFYVKVMTRLKVRGRFKRNEWRKWERDDSSRQPVRESVHGTRTQVPYRTDSKVRGFGNPVSPQTETYGD